MSTDPDLLRDVVDALDLALIVWRPGNDQVVYANRVARNETLVDAYGKLSPGLLERALQHRDLRASVERQGLKPHAERWEHRGIRWRFRSAPITDGRELLTASREVLREPELLDDFQRRYHLTNRQTDVLRYIVRGTPSLEIAETLGVALSTIYKYESDLREALGAANNAAVVRMAEDARRR